MPDKLQILESLNLWNCMALEVVYEIDGIHIGQEGSNQGEQNIPLRNVFRKFTKAKAFVE